MRKERILSVCLLSLFSVLCLTPCAYPDVAAKIVVANPSDTETKDVPVEYHLPPEVKKEDILDTGGLKVDYDVTKSTYYVHGTVKMDPKQVQTLKIVIRDVWNISPEKFDELYGILDQKTEDASGENMDQVTLMSKAIRARLDAIAKYQEDAASDVEKRMEMYSTNLSRLQQIKNDIFAIDTIKDTKQKESEEKEIISLVIEGENISDKELDLPLTYYLPKEIIPQYIEDAGEFEVKHDPERDQFYLSKRESFKPHETKRFQVKIKNVWIIPEKQVNGYVQEAGELNDNLKETPSGEIAQVLYDSIVKNANIILESQKKAQDVKGYIATYRSNLKILKLIEDDLEKMRALNKQEKPEEKQEGIRNILKELDYLEKIRNASNKIFKDKVQEGMVWRIILIVVIFLVSLTVIFYLIWFTNMRSGVKKPMTAIGEKKDKVKVERSSEDEE
ncbi:MAG: hypothetical protein PHH49_07830 [Candidatus Omnitrophica bacterium]|nr:hypothetical protein [Candidatus Omnitrophota bacterium]MDD5488846.1 hypothetical protein [Candidatus Omnitrophota bacterium]